MNQFSNYDVFIFDCDGVILDSNQLKIDSMENVLSRLSLPKSGILRAIKYFSKNFGKSRFHHVDYFLENIFEVETSTKEKWRNKILDGFSIECEILYLKAQVTPGFELVISNLKGIKYIASGSKEDELRNVFKRRGLNKYFAEIYGSPRNKSDIVAEIKKRHKESKIVMVGDAISDFEAASNNLIDFYGYIPYSNVKGEMEILSKENNFTLMTSWFDFNER